MKSNPFYWEIEDIVTQFCSAFDSIVIKRFAKREFKDSVKVRFVYAPKQRAIHNIVNKAEHITVPAIAVSVSSIERDPDRVFNKNMGFYLNRITESDHIPPPVPINIGINMSIITRWMSDMDQILSNIVPYANPYIIISWKLPKEFSELESEIRTEVLWNGSISLNSPTDMGADDKYRLTADTSFTIKTWLFKKHPEDKVGNIHRVDTNIVPIACLDDMIQL